MLVERITNPWFRFKVLFATLPAEGAGEGERFMLARDAFLHVVANYSAFNFQKEKVLNEIIEAYPGLIDAISDDEMLSKFQDFCREARKRNEIVSPAELKWVEKYVGDSMIFEQIEKMIYRVLLCASSHWDGMRRTFNWTISDIDKQELVRGVLQNEDIGSKRKMEIAQEFGEPDNQFVKVYYKKLLWDRHYDQAQALGVSDLDYVIDVIVSDINSGYFNDAIEVAQRFLPDRQDLIKEIQQIIAAFDECDL